MGEVLALDFGNPRDPLQEGWAGVGCHQLVFTIPAPDSCDPDLATEAQALPELPCVLCLKLALPTRVSEAPVPQASALPGPGPTL